MPTEAWKKQIADAFYCALQDPRWVAPFDTKYRRYFLQIIRGRLHGRLLSLFDPEDLLQELYQKIFAERNVRMVAAPTVQWAVLKRVAARVVAEKNRHHLDASKRNVHREDRTRVGRRDHVEQCVDQASVDDVMATVEARVMPNTWSAFQLTFLDGKSCQEAEILLKIPLARVRAAKRRVKRMLREVILQPFLD